TGTIGEWVRGELQPTSEGEFCRIGNLLPAIATEVDRLADRETPPAPPPPAPEEAVDDQTSALHMHLSPLQAAVFDILRGGKVKTYTQLSHAWGAEAATTRAIDKLLDRLEEKLAGHGMFIERGNESAKVKRVTRTTGGRD